MDKLTLKIEYTDFLNNDLENYLKDLNGVKIIKINNDKNEIYVEYDSNIISLRLLKREILLYLDLVKIPSIVAFNKNNVFTYPGDKRNSGIEDATIVATHLMLAAYNEGVDSCWINFFNPDELAKAFNLPEDEEILMLLDIGVADKTTTPLPNHNSRKALTETVSFI